MTTLDTNLFDNEFSAITQRLETVGAKFRTAAVLRALAQFTALVIHAIVALVFLAALAALPPWLNIALTLALVALFIVAYLRILHTPIFHRPSYAEIARLIEQNAAGKKIELSNELINAVLLAQDFESKSPGSLWIPHVLRELAGNTASQPLEQTVPWKGPRNAWLLALALLLLCATCVFLFPNAFAHGLAVLTRPGTVIPKTGLVRIIAIEPGNDAVLVGQSVNFVVTAESPLGKTSDASLDITYAGGKHEVLPMIAFGSDNTQYRREGVLAAENMEYFITVGDSESPRYRITVMPRLHVSAFQLDVTPPAYTGQEKIHLALADKEATATKGSLDVPTGSQVQLSVTIDIPVKEALLDIRDSAPIPLTRSADGRTFSTLLTVKDTLRYTVRFNDAANRTLKQLPDESGDNNVSVTAPVISAHAGVYTLTALPDSPSTISVTEPARDLDAKPGDKIPLAAQATDDYGLTLFTLEVMKNDEKVFRKLQSWPVKPGPNGNPTRAATIKHTLDLPATEYTLGDTLKYRFVSTDNRDLLTFDSALGYQNTPGQVFAIHFADNAATAAKTSKAWDELRKQLGLLLDRQIAFRKQSDALTPKSTLAEIRKVTTAINEGQQKLRTDLTLLAQNFPFEPPMKLIQKSLQVLVVEDATSVLDRASDILLLSDAKTLTPLATKMRQHQSRIIDVLQSLLAISTSEQNKSSTVENKAGGDFPNNPQDAWKKLAEELKEFQKEQKAVIDATADLAKKPKDQFDQQDEQKLKDLAAKEDKWEKFLTQRLVDMSKIAEQDQSNVSLLEELVQMKIELAAAKNALNEKQLEIATAFEDNGLESAKALTTHLERWLMAKPDRTQWQMEEPVKQNDQAMAELPKQLQDMVGDLMDKEEDVTEAMEDMGSKWADSLDKGAGWDAADGPMSNMSAQGVTGNQLPNDNEIQGRSGEGREGRASGEMVGAEAEGKGGRRTPTRMTPEPFSQGKVDDKSKEPAGGATGGGKKGGMGGEGLEGQAPEQQMQKDIQRMQGTQAAIRNEAERLQLQMNAAGFNNFKLLEAAVLMKKSEDALRKYHYNSALYYQKQAVQSLNTAKVLAAGEMHVTMDSTPKVSDKTQKDIENALHGTMPKGYSDPVKAYFQKLAAEEK